MGVLDPKVRTISRIDAWQALYEGMLFITRRVGHFAADGWQFFWERGAAPSLLCPQSLGSAAPRFDYVLQRTPGTFLVSSKLCGSGR